MDDPKSDLLFRLQFELIAMRGRAETAKNIAMEVPSQNEKMLEHAGNIERAATALEQIINDIKKAWE